MIESIEVKYDIKRKLTSSSTYIFKDNTWKKFWGKRIDHKERYELKFYKNSNQKIIRQELYLNRLDAFTWGLLLGSIRWNEKSRQRLAVVRKDCLPILRKFFAQNGLSFKWKRRIIRKRGYGAKYSKRFQVKYLVIIPPVAHQFFKALGLNIENANIPKFLPKELQIEVLKGYLHSKKCSMTIKNGNWICPRFVIRSKHPNMKTQGKFLKDIQNLLKELGINSCAMRVKRKDNSWNKLYIYNLKNLMKLIETFELNSLKIKIFLEIIKLRQDLDFRLLEPQLSELSLFILGLCHLHFKESEDVRNAHVIEYTIVQENLATSSNNMRKELYLLDELGFINYFARGKKEFIRKSHRYKKPDLNADRLNGNVSKEHSQEIVFECNECGIHFGYLDAWVGSEFKCPTCSSSMITSI